MYIVLYKNEIEYEIMTFDSWLNSLNGVLNGKRAELVSISLIEVTK